MATCRKALCLTKAVSGFAYCAKHKGTANIVLPITTMRVQVIEQLEWDRMESQLQTRTHTVSAPPGYDLYYLNVMAGPERAWAISNDPDHEWMLR